MKKLKLITEREFLSKVRNKSFIVMTFLSPLLMIAMIALVAYLSKSSMEKKNSVAFVNDSSLFSEEDFMNKATIEFEDMTAIGLEKAKQIVKESGHKGLLYIPDNNGLEDLGSAIQFYSTESPGMVLVSELENTIKNRLEKEKMMQLGIDPQKLEQSNVQVNIQMANFSGEKSSKMINGLKIAIGMAAGYLVMMFIIIYGAMVMRSVIEEKTSRIVEVIISSVKPFELMLGKVIGTAGAGLLQFLIWAAIIGILMFIGSWVFGVDTMGASNTAQMEAMAQSEAQFAFGEIAQLPLFSMFVWFILFFLGGYLLYSSIYAAIGSAVDNETDTQQFMLPVLMPLMIGFYIGFATVINDPHGTVSVIFSMIPFTSPIVMLMRIPFGVPWWQILISLILLYATFFFVVWVAAKIYRVGILMYGKKASYKELWKWIRY